MAKRPNFWYDTTIYVRVYLPDYPPVEPPEPDGTDDMSLELTGMIDGVTTESGMLLSVQEIDWGDFRGFTEELPD